MNNLSVKITADVVELQAKAAIARAELSATTSEMTKLAKAAAVTGTGQVTPELLKAAEAASTARSRVNELSAGLEKAGVHVAGIREISAAIREMASGDFTRLPGTFALLGHSIGEFGIAGVAATAVAAALAAGLGYLALRAIESARAIDQIHIGAQFAGNFDLTKQQISAFVDQLDVAANISKSDAEKIVGSFAGMKDATLPEIQALANVVADFAQATGKDAPKAAEDLARAFNDPLKNATEFVASLNGVTQAQINATEKAVESGNANRAAAAMIDALDAALKRARPSIDEHNASFSASIKNMALYASALYSGVMQPDQLETELLKQQNEARQKQIGLLDASRAALAKQAPTPEQTLKLGVSVAKTENPVAKQTEDAKVKINEMNAALEVAKQKGEQVNVDLLTASLAKAHEELDALNFGPVVERMHTDMAQLAATWDGTQTGLLTKQRAIAAQALGEVGSDAKQRQAILQEEARLSLQIRQAAGTEANAATRESISAINAQTDIGNVQKLERERAVWQALLAGDQLTYAQRLEARKSFNDATAALERAKQQQIQQIARVDADADIEVARIGIQAEKDSLDEKLQLHQINAQQKLAILTNLTDQEFKLNSDALEAEAALLANQPIEYARVMDQIKILKAKNVADLASLNRQAAIDAQNEANSEAKAWRGAVQEITSAESSFLNDYLTGRKTAGQSVIALVDQLALKEITADAQAITTRLLLRNTAAAQEKATEQSGFLYKLLFDHQDVASTATTEATKTAAVVAGSQAQVAAKTAAEAEGKAASAAIGSSTVMADAAKAAAGAYSAIVGIPYVGPVLAPIAAGVAFAAVAAYSSLASSEGGDWNVDATRLNVVHPRETIMPASVAGPMRDYFSGGGSQAAAGPSFGDTNFTNHFHQVAVTPNAVMAAMESAYRNGHPAFRRMARA
jgi:hypothetical protein